MFRRSRFALARRLSHWIPLLVCLACCGGERLERELNLLLVVLDTTRADALGVSGTERAHTPNLDALAAEGILFTHARSTSSWTVPAHGSLFTGLYPSNHGAHHENPRLDLTRTTLAEVLSRTHQTAGFSENSFIQEELGYAQGFGHFDETWRERVNWREPPPTIERVRAWLSRRNRDQPFFVFVNLMTPHLPYDPPERFLEGPTSTSSSSTVQSLRNLGEQAAQRFMMGTLELGDEALALLRSLYLADVSYADEQVGALIALLRSEGALDETLILVVGDHGENLGDHQLMEHQFSLHESVLRVPMIARLPGTFSPGERTDRPVQLVDVAPTVSELLGVGRDWLDGLDGRSFLKAPSERRPVLAEFMRPEMQRRSYRDLDPSFDFGRFDQRLRSIQIGDWKLILSESGEAELYDLARDPNETTDLADERPDELAVLHQQLDTFFGGTWEPTDRRSFPSVDEDTLRELRSLGYVH